jgi:hypothetical protein
MGCGFSGAGFTERRLGPRRKKYEKTAESFALRNFSCLGFTDIIRVPKEREQMDWERGT